MLAGIRSSLLTGCKCHTHILVCSSFIFAGLRPAFSPMLCRVLCRFGAKTQVFNGSRPHKAVGCRRSFHRTKEFYVNMLREIKKAPQTRTQPEATLTIFHKHLALCQALPNDQDRFTVWSLILLLQYGQFRPGPLWLCGQQVEILGDRNKDERNGYPDQCTMFYIEQWLLQQGYHPMLVEPLIVCAYDLGILHKADSFSNETYFAAIGVLVECKKDASPRSRKDAMDQAVRYGTVVGNNRATHFQTPQCVPLRLALGSLIQCVFVHCTPGEPPRIEQFPPMERGDPLCEQLVARGDSLAIENNKELQKLMLTLVSKQGAPVAVDRKTNRRGAQGSRKHKQSQELGHQIMLKEASRMGLLLPALIGRGAKRGREG